MMKYLIETGTGTETETGIDCKEETAGTDSALRITISHSETVIEGLEDQSIEAVETEEEAVTEEVETEIAEIGEVETEEEEEEEEVIVEIEA